MVYKDCCQLSVDCCLSLGVPATPSGFPLYLCSLKFHLTQKFPLSVVCCLLSEKARKGCRSNP